MLDWFTPPKFSIPKLQPMFNVTYSPPQCNFPEHDALSAENSNLKHENKTLKNSVKVKEFEIQTLLDEITGWKNELKFRIKSHEKIIEDLHKAVQAGTQDHNRGMDKNKRLKIVLYINFALTFIALFASAIMVSSK